MVGTRFEPSSCLASQPMASSVLTAALPCLFGLKSHDGPSPLFGIPRPGGGFSLHRRQREPAESGAELTELRRQLYLAVNLNTLLKTGESILKAPVSMEGGSITAWGKDLCVTVCDQVQPALSPSGPRKNTLPTPVLGEVTCMKSERAQGPGVLCVAMIKHSDFSRLRGGRGLLSLQFQISVHHGEGQSRN